MTSYNFILKKVTWFFFNCASVDVARVIVSSLGHDFVWDLSHFAFFKSDNTSKGSDINVTTAFHQQSYQWLGPPIILRWVISWVKTQGMHICIFLSNTKMTHGKMQVQVLLICPVSLFFFFKILKLQTNP